MSADLYDEAVLNAVDNTVGVVEATQQVSGGAVLSSGNRHAREVGLLDVWVVFLDRGDGFTGNYQRVKLYVQTARPRIAKELGITPKELAGMHRRFEVIPGAQAQVDWGDEGKILAHMGIAKVYSFHMTLTYSRDPFCCFTTSQDLQTFFDCHRRAFAHFGGAPMTIVYDRTKTVVRRHVAPGEAAPVWIQG